MNKQYVAMWSSPTGSLHFKQTVAEDADTAIAKIGEGLNGDILGVVEVRGDCAVTVYDGMGAEMMAG